MTQSTDEGPYQGPVLVLLHMRRPIVPNIGLHRRAGVQLTVWIQSLLREHTAVALPS